MQETCDGDPGLIVKEELEELSHPRGAGKRATSPLRLLPQFCATVVGHGWRGGASEDARHAWAMEKLIPTMRGFTPSMVGAIPSTLRVVPSLLGVIVC